MTCDSSNDSSLLDIIVLFIMSFEESMCKTTTSLLEFYGFTYFLVSLAHCCATLERSRDPFSRNRIALRFDLCLANWGTPPNPRGVFRGEPSVRNKKDCYALPLVTNGETKTKRLLIIMWHVLRGFASVLLVCTLLHLAAFGSFHERSCRRREKNRQTFVAFDAICGSNLVDSLRIVRRATVPLSIG